MSTCSLLGLLAGLIGLAFLNRWYFGTQSAIRRAIVDADRVELRAFWEGHVDAAPDLATITALEERALLAESIKLRGVWLPLDDLVGNSYRIRAVRGNAVTDIILRGGGDLQLGGRRWYIPTDGNAIPVFVDHVRTHGKTIPQWTEMLDSVSEDCNYLGDVNGSP